MEEGSERRPGGLGRGEQAGNLGAERLVIKRLTADVVLRPGRSGEIKKWLQKLEAMLPIACSIPDGCGSEVGGDAVVIYPVLLRLFGGKGHHDNECNESENESRSRKCHQRFPRFMIVPTIRELGLIEAE